MHYANLAGLTAVFALSLSAQAVQPPTAFEVASIKPLGTAWRPHMAPPRSDAAHISYPSLTFRSLVMEAYSVRNFQVDGPSWIDQEFYDIEAKIPEGAASAQIPGMLQGLLTERFGLKMHKESKTESINILVIGKGGAKLKKSDESTPLTDLSGRRISSQVVLSPSGGFRFGKHITMAQFARALSGLLGRPVLDMTDLTGIFDLSLEADSGDAGGSEENSALSSVLATLEGLGLKLKSRKVPIEHIVIDHAERVPTEN